MQHSMSLEPTPLVTFVIISRHNWPGVRAVLTDLRVQDYPHDAIEIVIIDSDSQMDPAAVHHVLASGQAFRAVQLLHNPRKTLSAGWNIALTRAQGRIILRVDAHSRIPSDFVRRNVEAIQGGEHVCGGHCVTMPPTASWSRVLYLAEVSTFGASPARFRRPGRRRYIDTVAHAAYSRTVFELVGGYDERCARNQDIEIHSRMRRAGVQFLYDPQIVSYHEPRHTLSGIIRQKFSTGRWIGLMLAIRPSACSARHLIPAAFVVGLAAGSLCSMVPLARGVADAAWVAFAVYMLTCLCISAAITISDGRDARCLTLPFIFLAIHTAYGTGTLIGVAQAPLLWYRTRGYTVPFPIVPHGAEEDAETERGDREPISQVH